MIRIFDKEERYFTSLGLGSLGETTEAIVREELNGSYELEMQYPITGRHFDKIKLRNFIFCKPNMYSEPQPFRIYAITKPLNGIVEISAEHISYDASGVTILPYRNEDGTISPFGYDLDEVLTKINASSAIQNKNYFILERGSDKNNVEKEDGYKIQMPMNLRSLIGGTDGSILDEFKGEWEFDRHRVILHNKRGTDRGITIRYGKNMTELEQETDSNSVFTGIFPFYSKSYSETKTISSFIFQGVYLRENVTPLRHDWLSLSDPMFGANTPLVPLVEMSEIIVEGVTQMVTRLVAIEVKTEGDYYGRLFAFKKNSVEDGNLVDVYISQRTIEGETETIQQIVTIDTRTPITPVFGTIYTVKGYLQDGNVTEDTTYFNRKIAYDKGSFAQYSSEGFYMEVYKATDAMPNPLPHEPYIVDGKTYVRPRRPSPVTTTEDKYVYVDTITYEPEGIVKYPYEKGVIYISESAKELENQRILTLDLTSDIDGIENMEPTKVTQKNVFDMAEQYLVEKDLTKIKESLTVSFIKLSDSPEYAQFKGLEVVMLGDEIDVVYERLGVNTKHRVISTEYNVLTNSYNEIELGDKIGTISDNVVTVGDPISGLKNDADYTGKTYVQELVAENARMINAIIENAIIETLQVAKINISGLLEASSATIDELVANLITADNAYIANLLNAGSVNVRGHITALSGEIGGSKIQNGELIVSTRISIEGPGGQVFEVDNNGKVTANALHLTGGVINIKDNFIVTENGDVTINEGSININNNFIVDKDGKLVASSVNITGGSIKIGGDELNPNFEVDADGNLTGRGRIDFGNFTVDENGVVRATQFIMSSGSSTSDTLVEIDDQGQLKAQNADIRGDIKATTFSSDQITFGDGLSVLEIMDAETQTVRISNAWTTIEQPDGYEIWVTVRLDKPLWKPRKLDIQVYYRITRYGTTYPTRYTTVSVTLQPGSIEQSFFSGAYTLPHDLEYFSSHGVENLFPTFFDESRYDEPGASILSIDSSFAPRHNDSYKLGLGDNKWSDVYVTNLQNGSDKKIKKDITYDIELYDKIFELLKPSSYKFIDGSSGRTHFGFIAQDVEQVLKDNNIDSKDFAILVKELKRESKNKKEEDLTDNDYSYLLRYSELHALTIRQVQILQQKVKELEKQIKDAGILN